MIAREAKTTSWDQDRDLAKQIASELKPFVDDAEKYVEILRKYSAEQVETSTSPPQPRIDGYGDREIWLQSELTIRQLEGRWIEEKKMVRFAEITAISDTVMQKSTSYYLTNEGEVQEKQKICLMIVYNGKIAGSITGMDPIPDTYTKAENEAVETALQKAGLGQPEQSQTWPYYTLDPVVDIEADVERAKQIAVTLKELYYRPEESEAFLRENTSEQTLEMHHPHMPGRDGYGSKEFWLSPEKMTRETSKKKVERKAYLKHENYMPVGGYIFLDEDRIYPLSDGTLYYIHCIGVMAVLNGKLRGFQEFWEPYPDDIQKEKEESFIYAYSELSKQYGELDTSMIPYI